MIVHRPGWAAWLAIVIVGCSGEASVGACEVSDDCARGLRCVDGRCMSGPDAGACGAECECERDSQCALGAPACVEAQCVEGACFFRADDARCGPGASCDRTLGCITPDAGTADAGTADASVADAGGDEGCGITSDDPNFQPDGYTAHIIPWAEAFYGNAFPVIDAGGLAPVGSFTFRSASSRSGIPMAGHYISVPFVPEPDSNYRLEWYRAQAVYGRDYGGGTPADAVYVTISSCPGDFRLTDRDVPRTDPRSQSCTEYAQDGIIYFGTTGGGFQCVLEPGRTYYLNIVFANVYGGPLDPTESTCVNGPYCEANFGN